MASYLFDSEIAQRYGVDEAIMIWNLSYWIQHNEANGVHFHDGRTWTFNSVDAFTKIFPFWTRAQIRRILGSLEDKGVIITGNYNETAYDRRMWYAFTDSFQQMHLLKSANGCCEKSKSIIVTTDNIDTIANNKQDNKQAAEGGLFPSNEFQPITITRPRKTSEGLCLFENSKFAEYDIFAEQFKEPEFKEIDLVYYYHVVADWSASKGAKKRDWIATARNIMRKDKDAGKLHLLTAGTSLTPDAIEYLKMMSN